MLDSRFKDEIVKWLKTYPNINIVTRDGSNIYREAISEALPNAIQISDKFHLFQNLTEVIAEEIRKILPRVIKIETDEKANIKIRNDAKELLVWQKKSLERHEKRKKLFDEVKEKYAKYKNTTKVAKEVGIDRHTVSKYIKLEELPKQTQKCDSSLDKYLDFICDNIECSGTEVYKKLKSLGYNGSYSSVLYYMTKIKKESKNGRINIIQRRHITQLLYDKGIGDLNVSDKQKDIIKKYLKTNKKLHELLIICTKFRIMIYSEEKHNLDNWLKESERKNHTELNKFINGIKNDYDAVLNCVIYVDKSNAVAEGNINKLKNIKKCMYGRCGFSLLKSKVLLCSKSR